MNALNEADGRRLAVDMLKELGCWWHKAGFDFEEQASTSNLSDDEVCDSLNDYLIRQEPEIFSRYLDTASSSPAVLKGFLCVVSEYIGSAMECSSLTI